MISVIVPVYNTQDKLPKCIESILNQTYKDIELILIDDGSIDESYSICTQYAQKYNNIKVLRQENKGVSVARNRCLDIASGQYVGFIDSDDYIEPDMFSLLLKYINDGYDLAACGFLTETEEGKLQQKTKGNISSLKNCSDIYRSMFSGDGCGPNVCNKLLKKDIIDKYNIRFPEGLKIGEDMVMLCSYVEHCTSGIYNPVPLYHYVTRDNSAYHKRFTAGEFDNSFYEEINSHKIVYNKLNSNIAKNAFVVKMYYVYLRALKFLSLARFPDKELYKYLIRFLRIKLFVYLYSKVDIKQKVHAIIMAVSPHLWLVIFRRRGIYNGK